VSKKKNIIKWENIFKKRKYLGGILRSGFKEKTSPRKEKAFAKEKLKSQRYLKRKGTPTKRYICA
jgi:hypothetical protein